MHKVYIGHLEDVLSIPTVRHFHDIVKIILVGTMPCFDYVFVKKVKLSFFKK